MSVNSESMNLTRRQEIFKNPPREFRGKPFWSWNGRLEKEELLRQVDVIKEMGFGGFFMHSRTGLETEYLGEEWFELTNKCAEYGQEKGMEAWLYDEDRWPSGSAGGMVTKEEKYRAMFLEMNILEKEQWESYQADEHTAAVFACRQKDGIFSEKRLLLSGKEGQKEALKEGETAVEFRTRYSVCNDNYNGFCYVNTMNREAVERYIELTHEKYREKCGEKFGKEILGIFTDEPHRGGVFTNFAEGEVNSAPYTPGMFEEFEKRFGYSLKENLPELFLRKEEGELSRVKRDYFELCQELFLECFAIPVYEWCQKNGLIFTGHVLHEDSLCAQSVMQGSLMRFYEYMEYPGIDLLSEGNRCYWVAKQIASVARQLHKKWVLSELYGCTGWQMNFESYKNIGDWQALLGVNLRCPHLSWYTMKGEAKRDYPASILHQSPWYRDYHYVEDYFSRIHAAWQGGTPVCSLLVMNPVESVWARAYSGAFHGLFGVDPRIQELEKRYAGVFHMLSGHQIDFDYGEEDIMARHGRVEKGVLYVGRAAYRKVLVAGMDTIRSSTLALLKEFVSQGGEVIFAGELPEYVDAVRSEEAERLAKSCIRVPFEEEAIASSCQSGEEVKVISEHAKKLFVQTYEVEGGCMVMLLNTDREQGCQVTLKLGEKALQKGGQRRFLERWDPRSGEIVKPPYRCEEDGLLITIDLERGGERLYLITDQDRGLPEEKAFIPCGTVALPQQLSYRLSEKNICVLDMVSVTAGDGSLIPSMEVLKADRALRDILGLPHRGGEMLQPWYQIKYRGGNTKLLTTVSLQYGVEIRALLGDISLVLEDMEHVRRVCVNGRSIPLKSCGKWIDICFDMLKLPGNAFKTGKNTITLEMDYYSTCGIEAVYLLGDFGVEISEGRPVLTELPGKLALGDITCQGLPFYSGSVIYELDGMEQLTGKRAAVTAEAFGGSLVKLLGKGESIIAFPPCQAEMEDLKAIEVVLTRRNTFGPLHQATKRADGYGPGNFVTEGSDWNEDYVLYEQGLLKEPLIQIG